MKKLVLLTTILFIILLFSSLVKASIIKKENESEKKYDNELLDLFIRNNIEFTEEDLIRLSKEEFITLIVKHTKIDFIDEKMSNFNSLSEDFKQKDEKIKNLANIVGGSVIRSLKYSPLTAVKIPRNKIADFSKEVRKTITDSNISVERELKILLYESAPLIGAPTVWSSGYNGTGIKIAIIDTGIDYSHPDFSGRVVAGYDFVNNDNDPSDDHMHGTHCAGAAAGSGTASSGSVKGIAPAASLLIAKVCNAEGSCPLSALLAGVEWAVNNGANVISMSIGGEGRIPDLENKIKWAVSRGVITVVAAGNSGSAYGTINSPGVTEEAITVGATYKKDYSGDYWGDTNPFKNQVTSFSSRGPTSDNLVKPDVLAPGALICSARYDNVNLSGHDPNYVPCINEKYIQIAGTSMATPHVAGAAALIKQAHPTWIPEEVKSALVSTSNKLNYDVYIQGSGRIDLARAINPILLIKKPVLSIGQISLEETERTLNISIKNVNSSRQGIRISDDFLKGIFYKNSYDSIGDFSANDFCLNPGETKIVSFKVALSSLTPDIYSGILNVNAYKDCIFTSTPEKLTVPVGLSKFYTVNINFSSPVQFDPYEKKLWKIIFSDATSTELKADNMLNRYGEVIPPYFYRTFFTTLNHFDAVIGFSSWSQDGTYRVKNTFMVREADLTGKNEITLNFNESDAKSMNTNIDSIIASRGMNKFFDTSKFWWGTNGFYNKIQNYNGWGREAKPLGIGIYSSLLNSYRAIHWATANKVTGTTTEERVILPVFFEYPFTNLNQNILESELKEIDIKIEDEIVNEYIKFFDLVPIHVDDSGSLALIMEKVSIPKDIKVFLRNAYPFTYYMSAIAYDPVVFDEQYKYSEHFSSLCIFCPPFEPALEIIENYLIGDVTSNLTRSFIQTGEPYSSYSSFYADANVKIFKPDGSVAFTADKSRWIYICSDCTTGTYNITVETNIQKNLTLTFKGAAYYDGSRWTSANISKNCNPDGTNTSGLCSSVCGASIECDGKSPSTNWCYANLKKSCNLTCKYSEVICRTDTFDSDGGKNYAVKGTCTEYKGCSNGQCTSNTGITDQCANDFYLSECYVHSSDGLSACSFVLPLQDCRKLGTVCSNSRCASPRGGPVPVFIGPYLLNVEPLIDLTFVVLVLIEIIVVMTIIDRLKHSKKRRR